ncbi:MULTISPECIES: hypothetical protein [Caloramator]|uniref:DUF2281 domain-containing protein n=1 Tax=Caloramator australicus RC3 TaxID=857293 RepID=I7J639_9CLOT|nr:MULTISPECIES: hypothetical protein [Caloramator]WDU82007.1 DUF2281 domain-containing protein [Caloramator sp. Dgby_cultured_2]CCJ34257.1 hypothetical protein CAAU_2173 [Caloramator australicus RC3]
MNTAKKLLFDLIKDIPDDDVMEIIDFITFLKMKHDKKIFNDLIKSSESSIDFWDNDIDDEVWKI